MKKLLTIALLLSATLAQAATKFATRTYELTNFIEIVVNNSVKVIYTQGEPYSVKLTGRADWLDLMKVSTTADVLNVVATRTKKFNNVKKKDLPDGQHIFILHLTAPCLQNVDLRGASSFEAKSMTPDRFGALLDGASTMLIDEIDTPKFSIRLKGASTFKGQQIKCDEFVGASLLGASQASIKSATAPKSDFSVTGASIDRMADGIFYATLHITDGFNSRSFDSRPSDAISLALLSDCPILMDDNVIEETGVTIPNANQNPETPNSIHQLEEQLRRCEESEEYERAAEIQQQIENLKNK